MTTPPITDQPPPDLVALVDAFAFTAADMTIAMGQGVERLAAATRRYCADRDALLAALGRAPAPTGERTDADPQSLALRNCLALARAKMRNPGRPGGWEDVVRFCEAAGVAPDVLRAEPTGERVPSQGWIMRANGRWYLTAGDHEARALLVDPAGDPRNLDAGPARWDVSIPAPGQRWIRNSDDSVDPGDPITPVPPATLRLAMLAAEDALLAVRDEITAAVGR